MRKFWNFSESGDERVLRLDGTIADETWWGDEVTPAEFKNELLSDCGDVTVWINSPGGDVFAAAQIYNALKEYPGKVTVKVDGLAASAASVIAMAGDEILMSPVSYMVIHNPSTIAIGDSEDMLRTKEMLDEIKEGIVNAYESKTGLDRAEISRLMNEESCFNAKKAVDLGFADGVLYSHVTASVSNKIGGVHMSKLVELLEQRAKSWENAKNYLESKRDESGVVPAEDIEVFNKMEADVDFLDRQIEALEKVQARDTRYSTASDKPILNDVPLKRSSAGDYKPATGRASEAYRQAFWNAMRQGSAGLRVLNDLAVGTDTKGGYLVPDEFSRTLVEALQEHNIMRQLARIIPTSSGDFQIPIVASHGTAAWIGEAAEIPTSDGSFGQVILSAHKLGTLIKVSHELLNDSAFPLETFLAQDFGRRIGVLEEEAFIVGDGDKKPTGFMADAQVGKTTGSTTAITFDDVMDLYHSLKSPYRNKAVFVTNDLTVKALRKLKDGNGQYLWNSSVVTGTPDTILGRPVYVSSFVPEIAAGAKVLAFGDFSYYWIGDRQGQTFERLNEIFAVTDQVGFKATQRVDGKLILPEAMKILKMPGTPAGE